MTKKLRSFRQASYAEFEKAIETLGMEPNKLCAALGYSNHAWHSWKVSGHIPYVASLAIKALADTKPGKMRAILIVSDSVEALNTIRKVASAFDVELSEVL